MLIGCSENQIHSQMINSAVEQETTPELKKFYDGMNDLRTYCKDVMAESFFTNNSLHFKQCDCAVDILSSSMIEANESRKNGKFDNQKFENEVAEKIKQQCGKVPNIFF